MSYAKIEANHFLNFTESNTKFPSDFNIDGKFASEMGDWISYQPLSCNWYLHMESAVRFLGISSAVLKDIIRSTNSQQFHNTIADQRNLEKAFLISYSAVCLLIA